jgi:hypothetical protein
MSDGGVQLTSELADCGFAEGKRSLFTAIDQKHSLQIVSQ